MEANLATKPNKKSTGVKQQAVKTAVKGAAVVALEQLLPLQGELKTLDRDNYEKYRKSIIEHGITFVTHIWKHKGKYHVIDGHQCRFTLNKMKEEEGWKIPPVPVAFVEASTFEEAKRKVLIAASEYGKMSNKSLHEFALTADIPFDEIVASFTLPSITSEGLMELYEMPPIESFNGLNTSPGAQAPNMKSSSDGVKQVVLFFNGPNYDEFMKLTSDLGKKHGKENLSDTLLEVVREASNRKATK